MDKPHGRRDALVFSMLTVVLGAMGCTNAPEPETGPGAGTGKADELGPESLPALEVVSLDNLVQCFGVMDDTTTDPFFQRHEVRCRAAVMPPGLSVGTIFVEVASADSSLRRTVALFPADFATTDAVVSVLNDHFPLRLRVTISFRIGEHSAHNWGFERTITGPSDLEGLTEEAPVTIGLPFELWPVALYPTASLADAWSRETVTWLRAGADYAFAVPESAELAVGGSPPVTEIQERSHRTYRRVDLDSLTSLIRTPTYYPMPIGGLEPPAALSVWMSASEVLSEMTGPGYYLVDVAGVATLTAREDLPDLGTGTADPDGGIGTDGGGADGGIATDGGTGTDGGPITSADGGTPDGGSTALPLSACGPCDSDEVCVPVRGRMGFEGECLTRSSQTDKAGDLCDVGDGNEDCAIDHVCVSGQEEDLEEVGGCAPLAGQTDRRHDICDVADGNDDCAEDHICLDAEDPADGVGRCTPLAGQTDHRYDRCDVADGNDDCADAHVCVDAEDPAEGAGRCTPLAGQTDRRYDRCDVADGNDDCADAHVCVNAKDPVDGVGRCTPLEGQTTWYDDCDVADGDGDCVLGFVCDNSLDVREAAGRCARP